MPEISCPVCGGNENDIIYSVDSSQSAQHFVLFEEDKSRHIELKNEIERLWGGGICSFVKCKCCELMFSSPFVGGGGLFYALAYQRTSYPQNKWEYEKTKQVLLGEDRDFSKARVFEVGAGNGAFLKKVCPELFDKKNVACAEFSDYGRSVIDSLGIKCFDVDFLDLSFGNKIDYFFAFQVFEHLDVINERFSKISSVMEKNGKLFLSFPNHERIMFNIENKSLLEMPPNHISVWNERVIEYISKKHGYVVEGYYKEPFSLKQSISQYCRYSFLRESQKKHSIHNYIQSKRKKLAPFIYILIALPLVAYLFLKSINSIFRLLYFRPSNSVLVVLRKK